MSTIDPRATAAERAARRQGSLGQLALALGGSVLATVGGAGFAYGLLCATDTFRMMAMNGIFDTWESPIGDLWPFFLFPGIFAMLVAGVGQKAAAAYGGRIGPILLTIPFGVLGALLIAVRAPQLMTAPSEVGTKLDPSFNEPEVWDTAAWIAYGAPAVAPVLVAVIAIIVVISRIRSVRKAQLLGRLAESGNRVVGTIVEVTGGSTEINGQPLITFTTQFVDHLGTPRFVTKRKPMPVSAIPRVDQRGIVFFEPAHVDDEKRIAVGIGADDAVDDALHQS